MARSVIRFISSFWNVPLNTMLTWLLGSMPFRTSRSTMPAGGHFPGLEQPDLLTADLRAFFTLVR